MYRLIRLLKKYKFILIALGVWYWCCLPNQLFNDATCTVIEDREGNLLGAIIADDGQWRFPYNNEVPYKFKQAIVQFEDRDYYDHIGFSFKAFARAVEQNVSANRVVSGGSTITMQVVRLMRKGQSRTYYEKLIEVIMATRLELAYTKEELLAYYASNAPFGGNVVGLDAASWRYFGRSANQLSWSEAATLAVLPNAPGLIYPGRNQDQLRDKRNRLLDRLFEVGEIDSIGLHLAKAEPLPGKPHPLPQLTPHLLSRAIIDGHKGKRLVTTIDRPLQEHVMNTVDIHHQHLKENEINNAAVLVLSVETGEVLAYVGNTNNNSNEHGSQVDVIKAPRSTGSILKPFLYASMIDAGEITPNMLIPDVPVHLAGYTPKNYNLTYDGAVPAKRALSRSLNVPAVYMLRNYGVANFHHQLKRMGMTTLPYPSSHYGLTLVLGGAEGSLWDIASMYAEMGRTLNRYPNIEKGVRGRPGYIHAINTHPYYPENDAANEPPVLSPSAVWSTFEAMLEVTRPEEDANWQTFSSSSKIAWKTGTSFGFRDAWAVGVTPKYVVAVWVGNADGEGRPGLVGITAAAPLLFDVFDRLPKTNWFNPPHDDMTTVRICRTSGHRASSICEVVDEVAIPNASLNTTACPYHQLVHLDATEQWRVDSECEDIVNLRNRSWFVLPPVMEWYYKYNHPNYQLLPPFREDCKGLVNEKNMAIIYPKKPSKIYLPVALDGSTGKTVFEVTHRNRQATVYWHLDNEYLGSTKGIHQMELAPALGKHLLTLVDEEGKTVSQSFEVVGKG